MFCFSILYYIQKLKPIIAVKNADLKTHMGPSYGPFLHCMMGGEFTKKWMHEFTKFYIFIIMLFSHFYVEWWNLINVQLIMDNLLLCINLKHISFLVGLFSVPVVLHPAHSRFDKGLDSRMKFHRQLLGLSGIFTSQRNVTSIHPHTPFWVGAKGVSGAVASSGPCVLPARGSFINTQSSYLTEALYSKCGQKQGFSACSSAMRPGTVPFDQTNFLFDSPQCAFKT